MSLMRPFSSFREDLDRIFHDIEQEMMTPWRGRGRMMERPAELATIWAPAVDIIEEEKEIKVKAQVPGIRPEDLNIEVENQSLILSGESQYKEEEEKGNVYRREIAYGKFFRRVPLPSEVKADQAKADFEHGILTVTLPKSEETRRHRIKVK